VQFDPQAQVRDFLDKQKTYTDLVSQVEQKEREGEIAKAKYDLKRTAATAAVRILEIQRDRA
jgi:hypothetical protein